MGFAGRVRGRSVRGHWIVVAAVVVGVVIAAAGCGGDGGEEAASEPAPAETAPAETAETETAAGTTTAEETPAESGASDEGDAGAGGCEALTQLKAEYSFEEGISDYVAYTCGTAGAAEESLPPVKIGWVNNQDGSVPSPAPQATDAAQFAVDYINDYLGGIDGHPLELVPCFVKNAEEEGLDCGQQFLNDDDVHVVSYGAVAVGADTINSTIAGKKPIIIGFSLAASNLTNPNTYVLFTAGSFSTYGWGTFAREVLNAKTGAVVYEQLAGFTEVAASVQQANEAAGIETTLVGVEPNTTEFTGALTAAGAQDADVFAPIVASTTSCLGIQRAVVQLGIDESKVVGFLDCTLPQLKDQMPGGDFPKWYYGQAQSGDALTDTAGGEAFRKALADEGLDPGLRTDSWYTGIFGQILTIAQFMNVIGYDNLSPEAIADQAAAFEGPLLLGSPIIQCGKYPDAPAVCADGDVFFKYEGDGEFTRFPGWFQAPEELQRELGAVPPED